MYTIKKNGTTIYTGQQKLSPVVELNVDGMSSLEFTDTDVLVYNDESYKTDTYTVYDDTDTCIFSGRPTEIEAGYNARAHVYCEGAYGYLNDTLVEPMEMPLIAPVSDFVSIIIGSHNRQVATNRQITIGDITVTKVVVRRYNYDRCIDSLKSLRDEVGGYIVFSYAADGTPIFNWYEELPQQTGIQAVEMGVNVLDFVRKTDIASIITCVLPLGPVIEGVTDASLVDDLHVLVTDDVHKHLIGQSLTLTNRSKVYDTDYIKNALYDTLGAHYERVEFQNATSAANLLELAQRYVSNLITQMIYYDISAADLHYAKNYEYLDKLEFAKQIHVISTVHNIDTYVPCTSMRIELDNVIKSIKLGTVKQKKLTDNILSLNTVNKSTQSGLQQQIDDLKERDTGGGGPVGGDIDVGGRDNNKGKITVYNTSDRYMMWINNEGINNGYALMQMYPATTAAAAGGVVVKGYTNEPKAMDVSINRNYPVSGYFRSYCSIANDAIKSEAIFYNPQSRPFTLNDLKNLHINVGTGGINPTPHNVDMNANINMLAGSTLHIEDDAHLLLKDVSNDYYYELYIENGVLKIREAGYA